jgi:transcription initiation factor TFIIE subunit alpha
VAKITRFPVVQDFLKNVGGEYAFGLVKICETKNEGATDEEIAKKLKLKVTEVRTILNRLHYRGIAFYTKTKNTRTGWYNYAWGIKSSRVIELLLAEQREIIEKLETSQNFEKTYSYFSCRKNCTAVPFEIAAEYQFKCPECNCTMGAVNSEERAKKLSKQIVGLKKEMEEMQKII